MTGLAQAGSCGRFLNQRTPSFSHLRRVSEKSKVQLWSFKDAAFSQGSETNHRRFPGFMYEKMVHQAKGYRRIQTVAASAKGTETFTFAGWTVSKAETQVVAVALVTCFLASTNKILYKMALIPMKEYPFFLAQLNTFGYVLVYFTILYGRYKAGIVTDDMLGVPRGQFIAVGALEALGLATGMAAAAVLPAPSIPVLLQVFLVWQLILSATFLGKRYTKGQIAGCLLVVAGVVIVVASGGGSESLQNSGFLWPFVMILSALFSAGGSILKEGVFADARQQLKVMTDLIFAVILIAFGRDVVPQYRPSAAQLTISVVALEHFLTQGGDLDIFVVNSFGSAFQALFVLLLLPFLSNLRGIPFLQLGSYLKDGYACFFNVGSAVGCEGSPLVPLLYVVGNMSFNISALYLMKISSAVISSLCTTASVPLSIFAFTLPLPYFGTPDPLPPKMFLGSAILVLGLAIYNICNPKVLAKVE